MSSSFLAAMNTRATHFAVEQGTRKLRFEMEKLKIQVEEHKAVEHFMMECFREIDYDGEVLSAPLKAHWRDGKVVNGKWMNDDDEE